MIIKIYDNKTTLDRYTIALDTKNEQGMYDCLCLSDDPTSPLGFSQFSTCQLGRHLGKRLSFTDLPYHIQNHIIARIN